MSYTCTSWNEIRTFSTALSLTRKARLLAAVLWRYLLMTEEAGNENFGLELIVFHIHYLHI